MTKKPKKLAEVDEDITLDRREAILRDLERIFLASGYRKLTVQKLASQLKCSRRTIYRIAPTKHELFLLVLDRLLERVRHKGALAALGEAGIEQRISAYLEPGFIEIKGAGPAFAEDIQSFGPARAMLEAHQRERGKTLRDMIEYGTREGSFAQFHAPFVAELYLLAIAGIGDPAFLKRAQIDYPSAVSELFQLISHGLFARREEKGQRKARS